MKIEQLLGYDVPEEMVSVLANEGFKTLFEPQEAAVTQGLLDLKGSFLISIPTASGKTLISELVMIKTLLRERSRGNNKAKCLYIVPLKALASEKHETMKKWEGLGIRTGVSTGDLDGTDPWLMKYDIIVATSEKVDSLTRHDIAWLKDVVVLVVDEIHLVHDPRRGPTLEVVIARMRHLIPHLIIIALSATIRNVDEIALWLDARYVISDWRPVQLREGIYFDGSILFNDSRRVDVRIGTDKSGDIASALSHEIVQEGGQTLVFSDTRRSAEKFAEEQILSGTLTPAEKSALDDISKKVLATLPEATKTCKRLAKCIRGGSAFHHAGLMPKQRRLVEQGFRDNIIKVISSTPTLAAGVNLPARRVIVRSYQRYDANLGRVGIPVLEYKQMAGGAGRPGYDTYGEAILIAKTDAEKDFLLDNYILAEPEEIYSKLAVEASLRAHVLSTIASNYANTQFALLEFFSKTLYAFQRDLSDLEDVLERITDFLMEEGMVEERKGFLMASTFGRRIAQLYIDPYSAVMLRDALALAEKKETVEISYLHVISRTGELGGLYLRRGDYESIGEIYYEHEPHLLVDPKDTGPWDKESTLSELKMASFLGSWIDERTDEEVREMYSLAPGDIRSRVDLAVWMMYSMAEIGRLTGYSKIGELKSIEARLKHGVKEELLELVSLKGVGRVRARALYNKGYKKLSNIRSASVNELSRVETIGEKLAQSIKTQVH